MAFALNKEQAQAVNTTSGNLLIIASAGTGKTTTIVERYVNLVSNHGFKPSEILMTTFTNKAAKDMIEKIRLKTSKAPEFIGTMHSLFLKMIRSHHALVLPAANFTIIDDSDKKRIIKQILIDMKIGPNADNVNYLMAGIGKFKNRGISSDYLDRGEAGKGGREKEIINDEVLEISSALKAALPSVYKKYDSFLRSHNLIDLDDILLLALQLLNNHPEVKEKYKIRFKAIMVDEAQDLNLVQMDILDLLHSNNLCLIGDDCQNIYEWRGSSNDLVFKFNRHYPTIFLKNNYRSTKSIISAVNKTISSMKFRIDKELVCTRGKGTKISINSFYSQEEEIAALASDVKELLKKGEKKEDIAVLFRTNTIGKAVEREFLRQRIPCHLSKSKGFFERAEIKDILSFLKLKANNSSFPDFERVILLMEGVGKAKLIKIHALAKKHNCPVLEALGYISEVGFNEKLRQRLSSFKSLVSRDKLHPIKAFVSFFDYSNRIKADDNAKDKMENINALIDMFSGYDYDAGGIVAFLDSLIEVEKKEKTKDKVALSTIHSSKGLEWKRVYLACCNDGLLPYHNGNLTNVMRDSELRLFYVAISRAKDFLTVTYSGFNGWKEIYPSEFLEIIN